MTALECPCCGLPNGRAFYSVARTPANSCLLIGSRLEAFAFPAGSMELASCGSCGFIWNTAFDPALIEYSENYEETQGYSETFGHFHRQLANDLIETYDLRDKCIIEIGCGKGEFLVLLSELGPNTGIGFDPAFRLDRLPPHAGQRLNFIRDLYSDQYASVRGDFICCKMTLEHIAEPRVFVDMLRRNLGEESSTVVFILVPDASRMIETGAFEDVYYEHCSYFTRTSLAQLFQRCGFQVLSVESVYDGQYLALAASAASLPILPEFSDDEFTSFQHSVAFFQTRSEVNRQLWGDRLEGWNQAGKSVVIWGSGSKAVGFLAAVANSTIIDYVVDINPHKSGSFMAGTGQEIVQPEILREYRPDVVIIMNAIYRPEISAQLMTLGLEPLLVTLDDTDSLQGKIIAGSPPVKTAGAVGR